MDGKIRTGKLFRLFAASFLLFVAPELAFGDGGIFSLVSVPGTPGQQAILFFDGTHETMIVESQYDGQIDDFAWVVPVPSEPGPGDIVEQGTDCFDSVRSLTQPVITHYYSTHHDSGCFFMSYADDRALEPSGGVQVLSRMNTGSYDVTVLSTTNPNSLVEWLNANGYYCPASATADIDFYVQKSWYFVAMKAVPLDTGDMVVKLPPIRIRFATTVLVYPMRISRINSPGTVKLTLYIFQAHRATCSNVATVEFSSGGIFRPDYDAYLDPQAGDTFVVEYAGQVTSSYFYGVEPLETLITGPTFLTRMTILASDASMLDDYFFENHLNDAVFMVNETY